MTNFWNFIWGAVIIVLIANGLFDWIDWKFNIPAIIVASIVWVISIYNGLVTMVSRVKESWADIEVQLKRR